MKPTFLAVTLLCAPCFTSALVVAQGSEAKTPALLPSEADVKTPAPPEVTGPGLLLSAPPTGAGTTKKLVRQLPAGMSRASEHVVDRVFSSTSEDGTIWARGRTYKASFAADGATFVPFFGSQAPTSYPIRFTTSAVRVGSTGIECVPAAPANVDGSVVFARGGFVERWRTELGGIEQELVFDALPASGDLVITVCAQSDLEASCAHDEIAFTCELGRVGYGAPVAVDARGQHFAMTSTLAHGTIELRLERADVERATLPLVVDPFVSTFPVLSAGVQDYSPDVAYDAGSDRYLIVYEEPYSGTDHDVYAELRDSSGTLVQVSYIDYTNDYWSTPRVASNALAGNFMCVAAVGLPGTLRIIMGNTVQGWSGVSGGQFVVAGADGYDKLAPDIGGDPVPVGPTYYLVTWERVFTGPDHDIHARLMNADGTLAGTGLIPIDNSGGTYDVRPAISKSDGHAPYSTQEWTIVWQRFSSQWGQYQIFASQVHWDGAVTHSTYPIDATSDNVLNPRVSSLLDADNNGTRPYLVVDQVENPFGDWDVDGLVFIGTTFQVGTDIPNYVDLSTFHQDQILPCVDSDGRHFTAVYAELSPIGTENYDVIAADLVYAGDYPYVCEAAALAATTDAEQDPAITSTYSGNGARRRFLVAWDQSAFQSGLTDVAAALYDGCEGGFTEAFCFGDGTATGCPCGNVGGPGNGCANSFDPNGANLASSGNPQVSADTFVLQATGMPHGGTALYFQGLPPAGGYYGAVFGDGIRCIATSIRRIGAKSNPTGSSQYPGSGDAPISIAGAVPTIGGQTFYQLWYRNAGPYCTASPFNLTNGLRVVWAP